MTRARILVVDDEPQIQRFLRPALETAGYAVEQALSGTEALRLVTARMLDAVLLDLGELLARVRTAMRHALARDGADPMLRSGPLEVDLLRRRVQVDGVTVPLTPREYSLLAMLARNVGRVLTHGQLLATIWGPGGGANLDGGISQP